MSLSAAPFIRRGSWSWSTCHCVSGAPLPQEVSYTFVSADSVDACWAPSAVTCYDTTRWRLARSVHNSIVVRVALRTPGSTLTLPPWKGEGEAVSASGR